MSAIPITYKRLSTLNPCIEMFALDLRELGIKCVPDNFIAKTHKKEKKMMNSFLCASLNFIAVHVDKLEEAEPAAVEYEYLMAALKMDNVLKYLLQYD